MQRIGYFIPEFPGQTHIFLWREREYLAQLGIDTEIISTKQPPQAIASHVWAKEAQEKTAYLMPFTFNDAISAAREIFKAGPKAWYQCLTLILNSHEASLKQKLRLVALMVVAGKLIRLSKEQNWSHIHVHSCADAAHITMFASILSDITYSLTLHGPVLEEYGINQKFKWEHSSFALIISNKLLNYVQDKLKNHLPKNLDVAPMGVNLEKMKRYTPYTPWDGKSVVRIFCCGRLNPIKGHNYLIETVEILHQKGFNVLLEIAGEDEKGGKGYRQELAKIIQNSPCSQAIKLLGAVSEGRIRQGLEEAHVFALASLNEGVPVAVMEAMAMELPVVITDVGANTELVDNDEDGLIVPMQQPKIMADAIIKVIENQELASSLSQKSKEKVMAKFHHRRSAEVLAQNLKRMKKQLVSPGYESAEEELCLKSF